jgi:RpiB/LacA/LacB family sugar-phosphate isomerase
MKIYLGADHRGFTLKEKLKQWLESQGYAVQDMGAHVLTPGDDYTDYASAVGFNVAKSDDAKGIVVCGSGVGVDVVANKIDGVRSAYE